MKDAAWCTHNNVRRVWTLQEFLLLLDWLSTENFFNAHVGHEFGETSKFSLDLMGKLTSVGQHYGSAGLWVVTQAVQYGEDEDGSLAHTRDGLAEHIEAHESLWDALLLDVTGMLKTTVDDRLDKLWSENHVLKASRVHTDVIRGGLRSTSREDSGRSVASGRGLLVKINLDLFVVGELVIGSGGCLLRFNHRLINVAFQ